MHEVTSKKCENLKIENFSRTRIDKTKTHEINSNLMIVSRIENNAEVSGRESLDAYIESRETNQFFYSRSAFLNYSFMNIKNSMIAEACKAPGFSSNILAAQLLPYDIKVLLWNYIIYNFVCFFS